MPVFILLSSAHAPAPRCLSCILYACGKKIVSIKFSSLSAPTKIEELTAGSDEKTQRSPAGNRTQGLAKTRKIRKTLGFDSRRGCAVFFRLNPAVSSSIFVGAEREENLIGMIPTRASLRRLFLFQAPACPPFSSLFSMFFCCHIMLAPMPVLNYSANCSSQINLIQYGVLGLAQYYRLQLARVTIPNTFFLLPYPPRGHGCMLVLRCPILHEVTGVC